MALYTTALPFTNITPIKTSREKSCLYDYYDLGRLAWLSLPLTFTVYLPLFQLFYA